jgi:hypothetical protein
VNGACCCGAGPPGKRHSSRPIRPTYTWITEPALLSGSRWLPVRVNLAVRMRRAASSRFLLSTAQKAKSDRRGLQSPHIRTIRSVSRSPTGKTCRRPAVDLETHKERLRLQTGNTICGAMPTDSSLPMPRSRKPLNPAEVRSATCAVVDDLVHHGLLLKQDKRLPSVITLLAGRPLSASWWSHPQSQLMFRVLNELADHPDVLVTKLLLGKDTFVHRSLWPAFIAVATAQEPWQLQRLTPAARSLLTRTQRSLRPVRSSGAAVRELVRRLLVHAEELHTEGGRHEIVLSSWPSWSARAGVIASGSAEDGRAALERASASIGAPPSALPWRSKRRRSEAHPAARA